MSGAMPVLPHVCMARKRTSLFLTFYP